MSGLISIPATVARYRNELFYLDYQTDNKVLISTHDMMKAKKFNMPLVDKGEFALWVDRTDVEILDGDKIFKPHKYL